MPARIDPLSPPYPPKIQGAFDAIMPPGVPPLTLFRTLSRDPRLMERLRGGSLLDKGNLTLRQREIVIDRMTALCGGVYEWGVHVAFFAERAGLDAAMIHSLARGKSFDACWSEGDRALIDLCDSLYRDDDIGDDLWSHASGIFTPEALMEIVMLAGAYRTISCLVKTMRLSREPFASGFPAQDL